MGIIIYLDNIHNEDKLPEFCRRNDIDLVVQDGRYKLTFTADLTGIFAIISLLEENFVRS